MVTDRSGAVTRRSRPTTGLKELGLSRTRYGSSVLSGQLGEWPLIYRLTT